MSHAKDSAAETAAATPADYATLQPNLGVSISGGQILVDCDWRGNGAFLDICEIQVDRGDGKGFVAFAFETTPG